MRHSSLLSVVSLHPVYLCTLLVLLHLPECGKVQQCMILFSRHYISVKDNCVNTPAPASRSGWWWAGCDIWAGREGGAFKIFHWYLCHNFQPGLACSRSLRCVTFLWLLAPIIELCGHITAPGREIKWLGVAKCYWLWCLGISFLSWTPSYGLTLVKNHPSFQCDLL